MQEEYIRLTSTDSVNSVNKEAFVNVELQQHTKVFPFPSISETIDQREVFEQEREDSTKYRLILTINPYCTNVLFNAITEIVQHEGTNEVGKLIIASDSGIKPSIKNYTIQGKTDNVTNTDMVRNTEYANGDDPFVYHCGYDIFNNHILRNQSFKLVNPLTGNSYKFQNTTDKNKIKNNFNTIRDIMRYSDGKEIKLTRRTDVKTIQGVENSDSQNYARHLYLKDDILSLIDSINANMSEQNGWWGFYNRSSIASCDFKKNEWQDMKISKIFNGKYFDGSQEQEHMACEFIEMYPDSTLYSFNPKYNVLQNREEQNWDICITYPYDKDDGKDKILIKGSTNESDNDGEPIYVNGLLLANYKQTKGTSGQDILLFRSLVKHNLKVGDKFKLFYSKRNYNAESHFKEIKDRQFEVVNIGNLEGDYLDYYFYINGINDLKEILGYGEDEKINSEDFYFRFIKVINDRDCKYYYRKFKKLPNFKFKKMELTEDVASDKKNFEEYVSENCKDLNNDGMLLFQKEQYPLAFAKTIYNDSMTQVTFTDTIEIDKIKDNLGRPLTEIFVTIIKRNKGHELWYEKSKTKEDLENIEFSHCFGTLNSGLEIHTEWSDDIVLKNTRAKISDCTVITTTDGESLDKDITIEDDVFYGDVVELDTYNMVENVLSDVHFRFNTEQREHDFSGDGLNCGKFLYDEIMGDDYDHDMENKNDNKSGWNCVENDMDILNVKPTTYRPEGYHYKAHYPIKVREFGSMRQGSHKDITISSCRPRQAGGMFIEVVSTLRNGANSGNIVYLCDDMKQEMIPLTINSVLSNVRFLVNPMKPSDDNYKNIFEICNGLLYSERTIKEFMEKWVDEDGNEHFAEEDEKGTTIKDYSMPKYVLRLKNYDIPSYAYKVATNVYLWRDVLNVGNKDTVELTEYPFANGHFYINKDINFFLKRQDPFGYNGLYSESKYPNDIYGNVKKTSNYEYKDEKNRIC